MRSYPQALPRELKGLETKLVCVYVISPDFEHFVAMWAIAWASQMKHTNHTLQCCVCYKSSIRHSLRADTFPISWSVVTGGDGGQSAGD